MRFVIDNDLCTGHARCNALASVVYELDDVGYALLRGHGEVVVAPGLEQVARRGADACPEGAIQLLP